MARQLKKTDSDGRLSTRAKLPGVPLLSQVEARDLMLATLHRAPFSDEDWLFQLKYDGYRCLVRKVGESVELVTRNGNHA